MRTETDTLVRAAQRGCRDAFREIYNLYSRRLYKLARGMTGNSEDAEDLLQEIFTKIFSSISSFRNRESGGFTTWVLRIGTNHSINFVKKRRIKLVSSEDMESNGDFESDCPEAVLEKSETGNLIKSYLTQLSPKQRAVLVQRYYNGLKINEIAEVMKCHEGSVKRHMYRGLDKLRRIVDGQVRG